MKYKYEYLCGHENFTYVASCSSARVHSYDDSALKTESKGGGAVLNLDLAVGVGMVIGMKPQECRGLGQ